MKNKIYLFILAIVIISSRIKAQEPNNKIYFLVDTLNMNRYNKFISIDRYSPFEPSYTFYCNCIPSLNYFTRFSYFSSKQKPSAPVVAERPNHNFIKWKDLYALLQKHGPHFDDAYELYITEVLPKNKYQTNKVKLIIYPQPVENKEKPKL